MVWGFSDSWLMVLLNGIVLLFRQAVMFPVFLGGDTVLLFKGPEKAGVVLKTVLMVNTVSYTHLGSLNIDYTSAPLLLRAMDWFNPFPPENTFMLSDDNVSPPLTK